MMVVPLGRAAEDFGVAPGRDNDGLKETGLVVDRA